MTSALRRGVHVWQWGRGHLERLDASLILSDCYDLGVSGVIVQDGVAAPAWCEKNAPAFRSAGVQLTCGLGMDGSANSAPSIAGAILRGLRCADAVMLNWEKPSLWESREGNAMADAIVQIVLDEDERAPEHITDCPWWAPLTTPDGHPTHPHAPTRTFGRLAAHDRYPQCYGAPTVGASASMLSWARRQYGILGAWDIGPSWQMYRRSVRDHVAGLLLEPTVCLWDRQEADDAALTALRLVRPLRADGYVGVDGVKALQTVHGLEADGVIGPRTLAVLGANL